MKFPSKLIHGGGQRTTTIDLCIDLCMSPQSECRKKHFVTFDP